MIEEFLLLLGCLDEDSEAATEGLGLFEATDDSSMSLPSLTWASLLTGCCLFLTGVDNPLVLVLPCSPEGPGIDNGESSLIVGNLLEFTGLSWEEFGEGVSKSWLLAVSSLSFSTGDGDLVNGGDGV